MGYVGNHLATLVVGTFAAILTGLWPIFVDFAPILEFTFIIVVPVTWFLAIVCWISQRSTDYTHKHTSHTTYEKKSLIRSQVAQVYTADGNRASLNKIKEAKTELTEDLNSLKENVKIKDGEIERLKQEISNLQTLVQIESLKSELANLKVLASKSKK